MFDLKQYGKLRLFSRIVVGVVVSGVLESEVGTDWTVHA